jgi:hypothetical protein
MEIHYKYALKIHIRGGYIRKYRVQLRYISDALYFLWMRYIFGRLMSDQDTFVGL